eukprot:6221688-Alexandrium_andersonii.AAC.1
MSPGTRPEGATALSSSSASSSGTATSTGSIAAVTGGRSPCSWFLRPRAEGPAATGSPGAGPG